MTERPTTLAGLPSPPAALYVHVPFCIALCPYCDFVVYTGRAARGPASRTAAYLAALVAELELRADRLDARFGPPAVDGPPDADAAGRSRAGASTDPTGRPPLRSVYVGGGTPSLLGAGDVGRLLERAGARFGLASDAEVTLEANPGASDLGDLAGFRAAGVTRLSLGAQSLDPAELQRLGRRHDPEDIRGAVAAARRAGFAEISVDLLYDVPGQTVESWARTLEGIVGLDVDHVSAYALTLDDPEAEGLAGPTGDHLPTRPGARSWRRRASLEQDEDRAATMYELADARLGSAGYAWYELSNWARPGHASRHNLAYWRREPYEALGLGAHAFDGATVRRWNAAPLGPYLAALAPGDGSTPMLPPGGAELLDGATGLAEQAILGLRLRTGLGPAIAGRPGVVEALDWGRAHGLVADAPGGTAVLTMRGRLLSNELFARLLPESAGR